MNHEERRALGRTTNNEPTLTDQSQADETNINIILKKYGVTGTARGTNAEPEFADHTTRPQDLRSAIEMARSVDRLRDELPEPLKRKSLDEIAALTPEQLADILTPPKPTTPPTEPTK